MRLNIFAQTVLPPINYDPYVTCAYYNQYVCDAEIHLTLTCKIPRWDTLNYTVCLSQRSNVWNGSSIRKPQVLSKLTRYIHIDSCLSWFEIYIISFLTA